MSDFFLNLGLSWTSSKLLPYILFLLVGVAIFMLFKSKFKSRIFKGLFGIVIVIPVAIYFLISPIYEGDFSNSFRESSNDASFNLSPNELTVIAIPNCPFCSESISRLNKIVERTGADEINFIVITADPEDLNSYKKMASDKIKVSLVADFEKYENLTLGRFPTFVYSGEPKMHIWSNDGFGVRAIDWVESQIVK